VQLRFPWGIGLKRPTTGTKVTAPIVATLRALLLASPLGFAGFMVYVIFFAGLPLVAIVVNGYLIGAVPGAVRDGMSSPAGRQLTALLLMTFALYVAQQLSQLCLVFVAGLGRRLHRFLHLRVMRSMLDYEGVAHLEDTVTLDDIDRAKGVDFGSGPGQQLLLAVGPVLIARLQALGAALILAGFRWWAPLLICGGWVAIGLLLVREASSLSRACKRAAPELRRADYYRLLAIEPQAAKEIRVFGLQGWVRDRFRQHRATGLRILWNERRRQDLAKFGLLVGVMAPLYAWVFLTVILDAVEGRTSVASMVIYLQAAMAVRAFTDQVNQGGPLRERAQAVPVALDLAKRVASRYPRLRSDDLPVPERIDEIVFEDVHFSYPGSTRTVLDGLTFTLPGRGSAALVGENGAGKTTAVKLLLRLYDPQDGRILVNGTDLRRLDLDQWRAACATVFQDFQRYPFSAHENLVLGVSGSPGDDDVERAARASAVHDVISRLPGQWDTPLSPGFAGGTDLSGGQWQRLVLARIMLAVGCGAKVAILDEPTSQLDIRAELEIFARMIEQTRGTLSVLVSHRFPTVRQVDKILVMEGGRLVEEGSHGELMRHGGRYATMFRLQAGPFMDPERLGGMSGPEVDVR